MGLSEIADQQWQRDAFTAMLDQHQRFTIHGSSRLVFTSGSVP